MWKPDLDGINHINAYSKGRTSLGRFLSNFWESPDGALIPTPDGPFKTLEGYWYWLGCQDFRLRMTSGIESKVLGRQLRTPDFPKTNRTAFEKKIFAAVRAKIEAFPEFKEQLKHSTLPLVHYYVYENRVIEVRQVDWLMGELEVIREELKTSS